MTVSDVILSISCPDLDESRIADILRDLARAIREEAEIDAAPALTATQSGLRGDPVSLGAVVLAALTSGSVVALFGVIKAYFERRRSLQFLFTRPDGARFEVKSENLDTAHLELTLTAARRFFDLTE